jgi:hypothetical protein
MTAGPGRAAGTAVCLCSALFFECQDPSPGCRVPRETGRAEQREGEAVTRCRMHCLPLCDVCVLLMQKTQMDHQHPL